MAKKSMIGDAADAVKSVAGAALGAAAVAATGIVVTSVANAIRKRGQELETATPQLQKLAGDAVSKPLLPTPRKRVAAKRKATTAKKKVAAKKTARKTAKKKKASAKRRAKR